MDKRVGRKHSNLLSGVSLSDLHTQLVRAHGDRAPSIATLKRMSADGRLDSVKQCGGLGRRPVYDLDKALSAFARRFGSDASPRTQSCPESVVPPPQEPVHHPLDVEALAQRVAEILLERISGLGKIDSLVGSIQTLDATRRSLMAKYDAHNDSLVQSLAHARSERATAGGGTTNLDLARIQVALSRIEGLLTRNEP